MELYRYTYFADAHVCMYMVLYLTTGGLVIKFIGQNIVFNVTSSVPVGAIGRPLGTPSSPSLKEIVTDASFVVTAVSTVETKPYVARYGSRVEDTYSLICDTFLLLSSSFVAHLSAHVYMCINFYSFMLQILWIFLF